MVNGILLVMSDPVRSETEQRVARVGPGLAAVLGLQETPHLRPGPKRPDSPDSAVVHRGRLIAAVLQVAAEKGYTSTTVAEVVRRARVSKATFYEHFTSKEACYFAAYREVMQATRDEVIAAAVAPSLTPFQRLLDGLETFLQAVFVAPSVARVMYLDSHSGAPEARELRRARVDDWARLLIEVVAAMRASAPEIADRTRPLDPMSAVALIAGIKEILIREIDAGTDSVTPELLDAVLLQVCAAVSQEAVVLTRDVKESRAVLAV
jgi:AcrR family transcriptional regulator